MDQWVHHHPGSRLSQATNQPTEPGACPTKPRTRPRGADRADRLLTPWQSWRTPDRADQPLVPPDPDDSAIFRFHSVILLQYQAFCYSELSHFIRHSWDFRSIIFLKWTMPFCYSAQSFYDFIRHSQDFCSVIFHSELDHFATVLSHFLFYKSLFVIVNSVILLEWTQPFYYSELSFCDFISHFAIMNWAILIQWTQPFCYSKLRHCQGFVVILLQ
jgi:hypothetical protein